MSINSLIRTPVELVDVDQERYLGSDVGGSEYKGPFSKLVG